MRKPYLYPLLAFFAIFITSCSKESQIEGLIATTPTVVEINIEVPKGVTKTIPLTINNTVINLQAGCTVLKSGSTETRFSTLTFQGTKALFPVMGNAAFIAKAAAGAKPADPFFKYSSYSGYLNYTANTAGATNYNYTNTNGIQYGNSYYIPVKFLVGYDTNTPVYAYLQVTIAADKLTVNKFVYNKVGSLVVGDE